MFMKILKFMGALILFSLVVDTLGSLGSFVVGCVILYALWKLITD